MKLKLPIVVSAILLLCSTSSPAAPPLIFLVFLLGACIR